MKCPRCLASISPAQNACSACGFSATLLNGYLGNQWVKLERITDAAHCLRLEDVRRTEIILDDFERSLPQVFFAAYLGVLPKGLSVAELGFWLLNQGAFVTHSVSRRNDFGIVLVVDPAEQAASITLGYAIEKYFSPQTVTRMLQTAGIQLNRGATSRAIEVVCNQCADVLRKCAHGMKRQPDILTTGSDLGLQSLRGGHRAGSRPLAGFSSATKP
ncbi:hypothetical protein [Prosthecobacter sp.]|uniref:hypothetical protein n=1 Tax=Prosthecobacter sp. TaxID=1965333 RepID=UPI001DC26579|nr:hypothetical protein [Prosthecobacter sp.]MCB1275916.1 hypothetical protein [Prosthecobacter sp.]